MSDVPAPDDAQREPTEEEVRAYLAQLRASDVTEVIAQGFSVLASGAEVKLGRRDARLLIDAAAALAEATADALDEQVVAQLREAVNRLRLAQVDAERQLSQLRSEGKLPPDEAGDLPGDTAPSSAHEDEQPQEPSAGSRLWIPGR